MPDKNQSPDRSSILEADTIRTNDPALRVAAPESSAGPSSASFPPRTFAFSYCLVLLDTACRATCAWCYFKGWIPTWLFWTLLLLVIPAGMIIVFGFRIVRFDAKYGDGAANHYRPKLKKVDVVFVIAVVLIGLLQIWFQPLTGYRLIDALIRIILTLAYLLYLLILCYASVGRETTGPDHSSRASDINANPESDLNDREIAHIESEIALLMGRSETFSFESSLLGALAFGAFVTVAAADKPFFTGIQKFVADCGSALEGLVQFDLHGTRLLIDDMSNEHTLLAGVAALSLMASVFFIAVIAARLRFNTLLASATYWSRIASSFNTKENELELAIATASDEAAVGKLEARLITLSANIRDALQHAETNLKRVRPVIFYMVVFRGVGLMCFFLALVGSALWIARSLAAFFFLICIIAYLYPSLDGWLRDRWTSDYIRNFHRNLFHRRRP